MLGYCTVGNVGETLIFSCLACYTPGAPVEARVIDEQQPDDYRPKIHVPFERSRVRE